VGIWLTALCRGVEGDVQQLWTDAQKTGDLQGIGTDKVWFIRNSYPVPDLIGRFNMSRMTVEEFNRAGGVDSRDCTRMYSDMPQQNLKDRMKHVVFDKVWRLHSNPPVAFAAVDFDSAPSNSIRHSFQLSRLISWQGQSQNGIVLWEMLWQLTT
jgi:hypothetical protein